jgi:hypothetical protein
VAAGGEGIALAQNSATGVSDQNIFNKRDEKANCNNAVTLNKGGE